MDNEKFYERYTLIHEDGNLRIEFSFEEPFTDQLVSQMIQFIRACGHQDVCIYSAMRHYADEFYEADKNTDKEELHKIHKDMIKKTEEFRSDASPDVD